MEKYTIQQSRQIGRCVYLKPKEVTNFRDKNGNLVKVETYTYNENPFVHFRQFRKTNMELPTHNRILFSQHYLPDFIKKLKEVQYKRNPNWRETFNVYHKDKDFIIEIEKIAFSPEQIDKLSENKTKKEIEESLEKYGHKTLAIRELKVNWKGIYRPTGNQIIINNTRKRVKEILDNLQNM